MRWTFRGAYDFVCPPRIVFGWGRRKELGGLGRALGRRAFLVCGSRKLLASGAVEEIEDALRREGVETVLLGSISREPLVEDVDRVAAALRERAAGREAFVIGLGGGSALDLAKAVAAMATNRKAPSVKDYLEGVGSGCTIEEDPLPFLAVPTTAGTGSEATKNAVISNLSPPFKKSLRSDRMVARAVLIDPELTVSVPPAVTASTGMDALTQLIESYISLKAQPLPQALAFQGLSLVGRALERAYRDGADREAREHMAHAALLSGIALANSGLGIAHGVAAALGIHAGVPHGLACAVLLPMALRINREVREKELAEIAEALCGRRWDSPAQAADALVGRVEELCESLRIPRRLRDLGVRREQLPAIVESSHGSSRSGNPRPISDDELLSILESLH